jgi:hypothetical protein
MEAQIILIKIKFQILLEDIWIQIINLKPHFSNKEKISEILIFDLLLLNGLKIIL